MLVLPGVDVLIQIQRMPRMIDYTSEWILRLRRRSLNKQINIHSFNPATHSSARSSTQFARLRVCFGQPIGQLIDQAS